MIKFSLWDERWILKHLSCTIQLSTHNSVKYYVVDLILIDAETEAERREEWKYNTKQSDSRTPLAHDYHSILPPTHFSDTRDAQSGVENQDTLLELTQKHTRFQGRGTGPFHQVQHIDQGDTGQKKKNVQVSLRLFLMLVKTLRNWGKRTEARYLYEERKQNPNYQILNS